MTKKELEAKVQYLDDCMAIWKLQSTYAHYFLMGMREKIPALFAKKNPETEIAIAARGVLKGSGAPKKFFGKGRPTTPGILFIHLTVNPVIEINKEGTRAKALWISPGLMSHPINGKLTAQWAWGKYDNEYIKEEGEWKFLKFRYRHIFLTPYDKGWVEESLESREDPSLSKVAERNVTGHPVPPGFYDPYRADKVNVLGPPPPEPYE